MYSFRALFVLYEAELDNNHVSYCTLNVDNNSGFLSFMQSFSGLHYPNLWHQKKRTRPLSLRSDTMSEYLGDRSYSYYGASMFIILTLGLVGNFLTVVVLFHPHHRRKSMTSLTINLCVADLLVCLFGYTVAVNYNTADFANTGEAPALCFWLAFINTVTGLASIGTLTVMAIITYIGISRNEVAQRSRMSGKTEVFVLSGNEVPLSL